MENNVDVLVIGAGPAGTVAASILNSKGFKVQIVEKQQFPRFVIGESLLPRCMHGLEKAGFIETIQEANFQKKKGAIFARGDEVCKFDFSEKFTKGWEWTWQVKRGRFDKLLADKVAKSGVAVAYNTEVSNVKFNADGRSCITVKQDGRIKEISSRFVVDSSGHARVISKLLQLEGPSEQADRTALFCHLKPKKPADAHERLNIIILVHKNVWGWAIPFSDGTSSVGIVGPPNNFNGTQDKVSLMKGWISEIPTLKLRFTDSEMMFAPKSITGYSSAVGALYGNGYVLTGNAFGFIDPIFSSGVTLATESASVAAELVASQLNGEAVDWETDYSKYMLKGVEVFKTFVNAWYDGSLQKIIFSAASNENIKKQICSVLAGFVWDQANPFVKKHNRALSSLARIIN